MASVIRVHVFQGKRVKVITSNGRLFVHPRQFIASVGCPIFRQDLVTRHSVRATDEQLDAIMAGGHVDICKRRMPQLVLISLQDIASIYRNNDRVSAFIKAHFDGVIDMQAPIDFKRAEPPKTEDNDSDSGSDLPLRKRASPPAPALPLKEKEKGKKLRVDNKAIQETVKQSIDGAVGSFEQKMIATMHAEYRKAYVEEHSTAWKAEFIRVYQSEVAADAAARAIASTKAEMQKFMDSLNK